MDVYGSCVSYFCNQGIIREDIREKNIDSKRKLLIGYRLFHLAMFIEKAPKWVKNQAEWPKIKCKYMYIYF